MNDYYFSSGLNNFSQRGQPPIKNKKSPFLILALLGVLISIASVVFILLFGDISAGPPIIINESPAGFSPSPEFDFEAYLGRQLDPFSGAVIPISDPEFHWGDKIFVGLKFNNFGYVRRRDYKFVLLACSLEVIGPDARKIDILSIKDAVNIEQRFPLDKESLNFFLTLNTT